MKKYILLVIAPFLTLFSFAQTPGAIGTANLTAWWKPDALVNGNLTSWTTTYPTGLGAITVDDAITPFPEVTDVPPGDLANYNKTLDFTNNSGPGLKVLGNSTSQNFLDNSNAGDQGTFFCAYLTPGSSPNDHLLLYNESNTDGIQFRQLGTTSMRVAIGRNLGPDVNACRNWTDEYIPNIASYTGNRSGAGTMSAFDRSLQVTTTAPSQSSGPTGVYLGGHPSDLSALYNGYVHEYIFFNRDLTAVELTQVHTYLAIKYGVTLMNTGGGIQGDYISTDGTTIWDASVTPNYHNDVIGIGRDDSEDLLQKQSHSFDDITRIYLSTLSATNASNAGSISSDVSYVLLGHNDGLMCGSVASNSEVPSTFFGSRLEREWKATNTNFSENYSIDFKLNNCTPLTNPNLSNCKLLVDDDGDFTNAQVFSSLNGLTFSYSNGVLTVEGISTLHIPVNATRYITVATEDVLIDLTADLNICDGDSTALTFTISQGNGPLNLQYTDGTTSFGYVSPNNIDSTFVSPIQTTTYTIVNDNLHFNCCGVPSYTPSVTITVNPNPTVVANASALSLCEGDNLTLTGSGATNYTWDNGVVDNVPFLPSVGSSTYTVIGVDNFGCSDTSQIDITVNDLPTIDGGPDQEHCFDPGLTVTLSGSGGNTYLWENGVIDAVSFTPTLGTTTYNITGTDGNGCENSDQVDVVINTLPTISAGADQMICNDGTAQVNLSGSGGDSYLWDNGVIDGVDFTPVTTGITTYTVTGTDANGCENTDEVDVAFYDNPTPIFDANAFSGCDPTTIAFINLTNSNSASCEWQVDNLTIQECDSFSHEFLNPGVYDVSLTITSDVGCTGSTTMEEYIEIYPTPAALFEPNLLVVTSDDTEVLFNNLSTGADSNIWDFGDNEISTENNPTHNFPTQEGMYNVILTVTTDNGCENSYMTPIEVIGVFNIYVPNAFTPDGDEYNNTFEPVISNPLLLNDFHLAIYNRWGEVLFESYDSQIGWDGTYHNRLVKSGMYVWKITYSTIEDAETQIITGHVSMVR